MIGVDYGGKKKSHLKESARSANRKDRLFILGFFSVLWGGFLTWRLLSLQVFSFEKWDEWASKQHSSEIQISSERGPILDRHGRIIAVSVPAGSVYVRPKVVKNIEKVVPILATELELDPKVVREKLKSDKPFVWLKRQIPREDAARIESLGIQGVGYLLESRRYYPYNEAAASLIGKVGVDGNGLSGLESVYEKKLNSAHKSVRVVRDAVGNIIQESTSDISNFELPRGSALNLTLDADLQLILEEELSIAKENARAQATLGVLVDADTGELLAIGQTPGFNLNTRSVVPKENLKNRIAETVIEPGSILKPIVAAAALEKKVTTPDEQVNCENGQFVYAGHRIKDVHGSGVISVRDVVIRSSNIGMTKIGSRLGKEGLYHALRSFGFGDKTGLKLPGESGGIFRKASTWAQVDVATHSFGQGIAVTPLQMVRAISPLVNGGILPTLQLEMTNEPTKAVRVISPTTAETVKSMMFGVVEDEHGTGKNSHINGVRVGGKTGTAQKARKDGKGYAAGKYVASFAGFVDASDIGINKKLALVVMVDEPSSGGIYGGTHAAPVFKKVMVRALQHLSTKSELIPQEELPIIQVPRTDVRPVVYR